MGECPSGEHIRGWLRVIAQTETYGRTPEQAYKLAWEIITDRNPFPAICGRVCPHPCEDGCNRKAKEAPVGINALERSVGDFGIAHGLKLSLLSETRHDDEPIAVVGSGPAGLSCAYQLARRGYPVTVFEAFSKAGGMMRYGIPPYRLPVNVLDAEIQSILDLGVELRCNTVVGRDIPLDKLRADYKAVFVGIGAHKGRLLGVPGENAPNVFTGTDFLNRIMSGRPVSVGERVIVVGGGDTAIDAARVSRRLGAEVTILYRRTRVEMPAIKPEIEGALEEGVKIEFLAAPIEVFQRDGQAVGMRCIRMELGDPDESGRRRPVPVPGSEFEVSATAIVAAISQEPDFVPLESLHKGKDWVKVDGWGATPMDGVFSGGDDIALGLVTNAVGHGRLAAEAIDARLRGTALARPAAATTPVRPEHLELGSYKESARHDRAHVPVAERQPDTEVELPLSEDAALNEARRCFSCGAESARDWKSMRRRFQYTALAIFAFLLLITSQKWWAGWWPSLNIVNIFSRLDPLQAVGTLIADRKVIWLYLPALLTVAVTILYGRVWCGWVCPLGAVLDLFGPKGTRKVEPWYRQLKYGVLFVILLMALFGSLAFMWFDPITVLVRGVSDPIALALGFVLNPWHSWGKTAAPLYLRLFTIVSILPLAIVLVLNLFEQRFWCRYLCPLGAIVGLGSKAGQIERRVTFEAIPEKSDGAWVNSCVVCGDCVKTCSMGAINPVTIKSDPAECVMCMDCAAPCPKTAITFEQQVAARWTNEFNPGRRELIGSAATSAAGLVLFNTGLAKTQAPDLLRPPGVAQKEPTFLAECIRCGQCVQACPGQALHPVWLGMSMESFWTPALIPTLGGCQYDCNSCGQICPSGAIPNLTLEDKRKQIIGTAYVDESTCINCMICEPVCPSKAIERAEIRKPSTAGKLAVSTWTTKKPNEKEAELLARTKPLPRVVTDKCNGCGLCEFYCPVPPSIKVYAEGRLPKPVQRSA